MICIDILDSKGIVHFIRDDFLSFFHWTFFLFDNYHVFQLYLVVPLVSVKICFQGKCHLAALHLTLEWFLTTVSHHVSLQNLLQSESPGTSRMRAFKGLFSTVNPLVSGEGRFLRELSGAVR